MRILAGLMSLLAAGCTHVYEGPAAGAPSANLVIAAQIRTDISEGVDFYLFENPDCRLTDNAGMLNSLMMGERTSAHRIPAGQRVHILVHRLTHDMLTTAFTSSTANCYDVVSFTPAAGGRYSLSAQGLDQRCALVLIDGEGHAPPDKDVVEAPAGCIRPLGDFERAEVAN